MNANIDFKLANSILSFFEAQCAEQFSLAEKAQSDKDEMAFNHHYNAYNIARKRLFKEAARINAKLDFQKT